MNVLLLSDTHGSFKTVKNITLLLKITSIDCIFHAGDFSHFGRYYEQLFNLISEAGIPIVYCSGNHESKLLCEDIIIPAIKHVSNYALA